MVRARVAAHAFDPDAVQRAVSEMIATDKKALRPAAVELARPRFRSGDGWANVVSVQLSGEPEQLKARFSLVVQVVDGQAVTVTFSVALATLQAFAVVEPTCVGAESVATPPALLPLKVLVYRLGPLSSVSVELTVQPCFTQLVGSSRRQSPPPVERT
jgi:hypothetical protein